MPKVQAMPATLTAGEFAETLQVEESTIYRWARDGVVPSIRIGGVVRFRTQDVEALLRGDDETTEGDE